MDTLKHTNPLFLDVPAVRARVVFALSHIYVLQAQGEFPARYYFGEHRRRWAVADINKWMQDRIDARKPNGWNNDLRPIITDADRFIAKRELRLIVPYSPRRLRVLEKEGRFPPRIHISPQNRVWLYREVLHWLSTKRPEGSALAIPSDGGAQRKDKRGPFCHGARITPSKMVNSVF
jgi:predicted DNA-binding transcriptional regulator AlpA